ncbi:hypothetical protein ACFVZC_02195 [Streptomyces marokkonensis]|uniref:Uncharacterized protein n=1 Tax=Streptomyces marokkonensis TaxID=324855 RepID=A0ABW6Q034_9ACTN
MDHDPAGSDLVGLAVKVFLEHPGHHGLRHVLLQPAAFLGNERRWKEKFREATPDAVWAEVERGAGTRLDYRVFENGDVRCNRTAYGFYAGRRWYPFLDGGDSRDLAVRDAFFRYFGKVTFTGTPPALLAATVMRVVARHPSTAVTALRWLGRTVRRVGVARLVRHRMRVRPVTFVMHQFMDADVVGPAWEMMQRGEQAEDPGLRETQEGKSAQTAARDLAALPGTRLEWVVRSPAPDWGAVPDDPLPGRQELVSTARTLATGGHDRVLVHTGAHVQSLSHAADGDRVLVRLATADGPREVLADHVVSLTGYTGDHTLYRQLQVHECYATGAPMNLSAALLGAAGGDCLAQPATGIAQLRSPEPDFFILGAKSYGRLNTFLLRTGYQQVDEIAAGYAATDPRSVRPGHGRTPRTSPARPA